MNVLARLENRIIPAWRRLHWAAAATRYATNCWRRSFGPHTPLLALALVLSSPARAGEAPAWVASDGIDGGTKFQQAVLLSEGAALILRCFNESPRRLSTFVLLDEGLGASLTERPEYRRVRYRFDQDLPTNSFWSYNDTVVSIRQPDEALAFSAAVLRARALTLTTFRRDGRSQVQTFTLPESREAARAVVDDCKATSPAPGPAPLVADTPTLVP